MRLVPSLIQQLNGHVMCDYTTADVFYMQILREILQTVIHSSFVGGEDGCAAHKPMYHYNVACVSSSVVQLRFLLVLQSGIAQWTLLPVYVGRHETNMRFCYCVDLG